MSDTPTYDQLSALCAQMGAALDGGASALKVALNSMRPDDPERHKCVALGDEMVFALTAYRTLSPDPVWQRVPEGCVVVPVNPTMKMLAAGQSAWVKDDLKRTTTLWAAMLGARGEG